MRLWRQLGISSNFLPSGHLGASYRLADAAVISAHLGALGRPPSFQELYGNGVFPGFPLPGRSLWLTLKMQTSR